MIRIVVLAMGGPKECQSKTVEARNRVDRLVGKECQNQN